MRKSEFKRTGRTCFVGQSHCGGGGHWTDYVATVKQANKRVRIAGKEVCKKFDKGLDF